MSGPADGAPAFPRPSWDKEYDHEYRQDGMSLRDYFAAAALTALVHAKPGWLDGVADTALAAYAYADAMLAERAKREEADA